MKWPWARHELHHGALAAGLQSMGLEFLVDAKNRLPQLNSVIIPDGANDAQIRKDLLEHHQLEIGAGLGPIAGKVWRIGLMGYSCNQVNVMHCLSALGNTLNHHGVSVNTELSLESAKDFYRDHSAGSN